MIKCGLTSVPAVMGRLGMRTNFCLRVAGP